MSNEKDWFETPRETAGLFPKEDAHVADAPLSLRKDGTAFLAIPSNVDALQSAEDWKPGGIIRVGPSSGSGASLQPIAPAGDEQIIRALLTGIIGENADREGLQETPKRVAKAWREMTKGYSQNPADILKAFEDGAEGTQSQWVIVKDIPIYSNCEHHLLPFFGTATIGYVPNGKVVGLSKLARLADVFAKRLQVQERLTNQIAQALIYHAGARCAMVSVNCRHMCMEARGIQREGATTSTLAYRTIAMDQESRDEYRREFFEQLKVA